MINKRTISRISAMVTMVLSLLIPTYLWAETSDSYVCQEPDIDWNRYQWTLITGNGVECCVEMFEYLKSRPSHQAPPVCPEDRLPPNENWARPESRFLNENEMKDIRNSIPDSKPWLKEKFEKALENSKTMQVLKADITLDGKPEYLLTYSNYSNYDYREACRRSVKCANENRVFKAAKKYSVTLKSEASNLLPMESTGTKVDWNHKAIRSGPLLMLGELVFYKKYPYWISAVRWNQASHDDFLHSRMRPGDPYSAIFTLVPINVYSRQTPQSKQFEDISDISPKILDPQNKKFCRFGYFHRENIKLNLPHKRK